MVINNHKRIDILEEQVSAEQARVKFLEEFSDELDGKVGKLEGSLEQVKKEISGQKKSLKSILMIVNLISNHQKETNRCEGRLIKSFQSVSSGLLQNFVIYGLIQVAMRITFLDQTIETLLGILRLGMNKGAVDRSKFMIKFGVSLALFFMLKERIRKLLSKLRGILSYLAI